MSEERVEVGTLVAHFEAVIKEYAQMKLDLAVAKQQVLDLKEENRIEFAASKAVLDQLEVVERQLKKEKLLNDTKSVDWSQANSEVLRLLEGKVVAQLYNTVEQEMTLSHY